MFDAIFWDMDGTIVDTERVVWEVMLKAFRKAANIELPADLFEKLLGQSELDFYRNMVAMYSLTADDVERIKHTFDLEYIPKLATVPPLPGAVEKVHETATLAPIALVTGSTSAQASAVINALEIAHLFRDIVACDMYERGKPDPLPFLMAAENLDVDPAKCLAIEDSPSGVRAAKAAGMKVVGVHEGNKGKYKISHADVEIATLNDLDLRALARDLG
ncbi:MAG: HAD family phosphatase [Planctomycetes bacterium]|nr:HAD family phosphatase [Planctomycetota bacterium]